MCVCVRKTGGSSSLAIRCRLLVGHTRLEAAHMRPTWDHLARKARGENILFIYTWGFKSSSTTRAISRLDEGSIANKPLFVGSVTLTYRPVVGRSGEGDSFTGFAIPCGPHVGCLQSRVVHRRPASCRRAFVYSTYSRSAAYGAIGQSDRTNKGRPVGYASLVHCVLMQATYFLGQEISGRY